MDLPREYTERELLIRELQHIKQEQERDQLLEDLKKQVGWAGPPKKTAAQKRQQPMLDDYDERLASGHSQAEAVKAMQAKYGDTTGTELYVDESIPNILSKHRNK